MAAVCRLEQVRLKTGMNRDCFNNPHERIVPDMGKCKYKGTEGRERGRKGTQTL